MGTPHNYRYQLTVMCDGYKDWETTFTWFETLKQVERHMAANSKRYSWKILDTVTGEVSIRLARHRQPRKAG